MQVGLTALLVIAVVASAWATFAVAYGSLTILEPGVVSVLATFWLPLGGSSNGGPLSLALC
jgi:hypothetical protein